MGLDMYLSVNKYVMRKNRDGSDNERFKDIIKSTNSENLVKWDDWAGLSVDIPVGYWRKANQIHGWIIQNCAGGEDNGQKIQISRNAAIELVKACKQVLADHSSAEQLLPPTVGFFFGGYEIDEWYFRDLERTIEIIEPLITDPDIDGLEYVASW